ncbi:transglutaminase family protein [Portibacter lacus]|uniref:IMP dehydrogenase n=1 Tax=Portibacter lacus TaxID=1099794 RepID=A0AA37SP81_9BACT|nr:transglutaminase family protein [Portibacter lacus]GLR16957.1 IMP dehydrogenase [Portibacter lacus]
MGIQVAIRHNTKYTYDRPIKVWPQIIRLRPAAHSRTKISGYSLNIKPEGHFINWMQDPFGNYQARVVFPEKISSLEINVEVLAELVSVNPFDFFVEESAETFPFDYDDITKQELRPYLEITESEPLLLALFEQCQKYKGQSIVDFLVSLNMHIYNLLDYTVRMEPGVQSAEETLRKKLGSCRDFAWLFVMLARHFGLAARFVSGYLVQLKADEKSVTGPSGPEEDFTDLHAWVEIFIPGAGWIGLDATSGLFAGEGHIPLACTPHYSSASPITGATEVTTVKFDFANSVERIYETPRVTKPYTDHQIEKIHHLGFEVDKILTEGDVRLTMGGEPTFVSDADMESEQWNTEADGKDKRVLALKLAHELKEKFAKKTLLHFGQGKWYPGEPVPRWQYSIYWKKDGKALWSNDKLIGDPNTEGKLKSSDAGKFMEALTASLGLAKSSAMPAYEDKYYYLWSKANLPVDLKDMKDQSLERKTLENLLKKGLDDADGSVLPLQWDLDKNKWISCEWEFEREKLFLIPGNSEIGYRLPLDRISIKSESVENIEVPADPLNTETVLLEKEDILKTITTRSKNPNPALTEKVFKTAMCAQVVSGNLHLFLPPLEEINAFLDLIYSIEYCAQKLEMPVIIEGYQPPFNKHIQKLAVTPDPGVIEVNVHPANSWPELLDIYNTLFSEAREIGLGTNKFMLDGKHTGTGGGNHITLGGVSPADSPMLRRPDLLRSMLAFWQNHPSLSYLFSSAFIGPTSQAPRVDEGRPDNIYELEIAFAELEKHENPPFWMVDRLLRNLLTDLTGNTHRSEFCIDKLYSPDSSTGRLGILELRGFDMPPHKEMNIVQLLLIRSLIAAFWKNPYKNKLIHWGTDLHSRWMMHHFIQEDIHEVVDYLNAAGIAFEKEWFEPFLEFRFPMIGQVNVQGVNLKLRSAIEPWIVLGEEMTSSGTSRYVDSSVERIEVVVENFNHERYKVLCNSVEVPLVNTPYNGKYVASVRYKAWAPYSALHPTIDVNSPLVFDIYDTWNARSIGGCTYHVMHPGGRSYDTFPVNSLEAESRRTTRFWDFNHSPKSEAKIENPSNLDAPTRSYVVVNKDIKEKIEVKQIPVSKEFPHTLDLRRG